jgi:alpha-L-glutamate ligase-like protein
MFPFTKLTKLGIVGQNSRNIDLIFPKNPRENFYIVDDKLETKVFMKEHGIPCPETYGSITSHGELRNISNILNKHKSFAIKPANGRKGNGITIIVDHDEREFITSSGNKLSLHDIKHRVENILNGLYSNGGRSDSAIIEYKIISNELLEKLSYKGIADIRIIVCDGKIVMAMLRLPTKTSDGKANLHQGGVGVGINLETGKTEAGVSQGQLLTDHPDQGISLSGYEIPFWKDCCDIAVKFQTLCGLGYVGIDIVIDRDFGPMVLEGNARPGLEIQVANRKGLWNAFKEMRSKSSS